MPIRVAHEPPIAEAGQLALATGRATGAQRARELAEERAVRLAEQARLERAERARTTQAAQEMEWEQRKFYETEGFKQERDDVQWRRDLERMGIDYEMQQKIEVWREQVKSAGEDARYNTKQLRDIEAINERLRWVNEQEGWPDEDKHYAQRELVGQLLKITPFPAPQRQYPKGQGQGELWLHEKTGATMTRDRYGIPKMVYEPKDQTKHVADLYSDLLKNMTTMDANGNPALPDHEAVMTRLRAILAEARQGEVGAGPGADAGAGKLPGVAADDRMLLLDHARQAGEAAGRSRLDAKAQEEQFRRFVDQRARTSAGLRTHVDENRELLQEMWQAFQAGIDEGGVPDKALAKRSAEALSKPPELKGKETLPVQWWLAATMIEPGADNRPLLALHGLFFEQGKYLADPEVVKNWNRLTETQKKAVTRALEVTGKLAVFREQARQAPRRPTVW